MQRRLIALLLGASALWLGAVSIRDALDAPEGGLDRAARRFAGITGLTAAAESVPRTTADRYVVTAPAAGGRVRPAVAEMYVAKALLPAARTAEPGTATLEVRIGDDGAVTVERLR